ncbi:hypothetical protein ACM9XD_02385 [Xanthomonas sacchari]
MQSTGERQDPIPQTIRTAHVLATSHGRITLVVESHGAAMAKALAVLCGAAIEQALRAYFPEGQYDD